MPKSRCAECSSSVEVGDDDAHGTRIACPSCETALRVIRAGDRLGLVHYDTAPLREAHVEGMQRQSALEKELARARASVGIGVNGLGLGLLYVVARIALEGEPLTGGLLVSAGLIALGSGVALELANTLFLAKRQQVRRLAAELEAVSTSNRILRRKLRAAMRSS